MVVDQARLRYGIDLYDQSASPVLRYGIDPGKDLRGAERVQAIGKTANAVRESWD